MYGFNEATAVSRGSQSVCFAVSLPAVEASMRPRLLAVDHKEVVDAEMEKIRSFNEATAVSRGSPHPLID